MKWDTPAHVNMIYSVENAFGVKFSIQDGRWMKVVGELIQLIKKKKGG